jgi:hypothetical protein
MPVKAEDTIPLRHSVLWPEREVSHVSLPEDKEGYHFGAFLPSQRRETPICIISLFLAATPRTEVDDSPSNSEHHTGAARFRKFACHPVYQRRMSTFLYICYQSSPALLRRYRNEATGTCLFRGIFRAGRHSGVVRC